MRVSSILVLSAVAVAVFALAVRAELSSASQVEVTYSEVEHTKLKCKACRGIVKFLVKEVGSDASREALHGVIGKVCHHLGPLHSMCEKVLDDAADALIDAFIESHGDPEITCEHIHMCKKPDELEM